MFAPARRYVCHAPALESGLEEREELPLVSTRIMRHSSGVAVRVCTCHPEVKKLSTNPKLKIASGLYLHNHNKYWLIYCSPLQILRAARD